MRYTAVVRQRNAPTAYMKAFRAIDIREAAEVVRAKYGFDTDKPHKGFTINEVHRLPTSTRNDK
jgi:hypothetical protein